MYYTYFIRSEKNNKIYVGYTSKDPKIRTKEHNLGSNIFTKQNAPFKLIYIEKYYCLKDAQLKEDFYKMGFGKQIKFLIVNELTKKFGM